MAALLSENSSDDNGGLVPTRPMHPALHSWREDLPATFVRMLAYVGGIAVLSIIAARLFQSPPVMSDIKRVHQSEWIGIDRPIPAFALSIPEAAGMPSSYAISRHADGGGRKDTLTLGEADGIAPFLQVDIYRPGRETRRFAEPVREIATNAEALGPVELRAADEEQPSKFGPLSIVTFETSKGNARYCLGFVRVYDEPLLQISGWFCQGAKFGGGEFIDRGTLACALDRLSLLAAGSEPKVAALFAQAELNRSFCRQRNILLAPTPKHRALWSKSAAR
jgi:hypothetical protein